MNDKQGFGLGPTTVTINPPKPPITAGQGIPLTGTVTPSGATVYVFIFNSSGVRTYEGSVVALLMGGTGWSFSVVFPSNDTYTVKVVYEDTTGQHEHASQTISVTVPTSRSAKGKKK